MKKTLALILVILLILPLVACDVGGGTKLQLGETASTDIVDFTLEDAAMCYYADSLSTNFGAPLDKSSGGMFVANTGYTLVSLTFTVKNKDRSSLNFGDESGNDWKFNNWSITYDGKSHSLRGFSIHDKDGYKCVSLHSGAIVLSDGSTTYELRSHNTILDAGKSTKRRVVCIAKFDPNDVKDSFDVKVGVVNSSGKTEKFTFSVPAR